LAVSEQTANLTVGTTVCATLLSVWLFLYMPLTLRLARWYVRRSLESISNVHPLAPAGAAPYVTQGFGIVAVAGWRLCLACYASVFLWVVVPVASSLMALSFSFSLTHPR
jgi:hypothetical protein